MYSLQDTWGFPCKFPHSEISGSLAMCAYPKLIAAYHVLHRLLMPRHSPCALCSLTYAFYIIKLSIYKEYFLACCIYTNNLYTMCNFQRTNWVTFMVSQNWTDSLKPLLRKKIFLIFLFTSQVSYLLDFSIERRWSSRRFSYGYLVTTSPQSLTLP